MDDPRTPIYLGLVFSTWAIVIVAATVNWWRALTIVAGLVVLFYSFYHLALVRPCSQGEPGAPHSTLLW
jgi:uncharacterized membrane protein